MDKENVKINSYHDLIVWKKGMELAKNVYLVTEEFPKSEIYGLTNQLRRAAISVPSNIAEGHSRHSTAEFSHFLRISLGSLAELDTQLILSKELDYIPQDTLNQFNDRISDLRKMIHALITRVAAYSK